MLVVELTDTIISRMAIDGIQSENLGHVADRELQAILASSGVIFDPTVVADSGFVRSNPEHSSRIIDQVSFLSLALT